MKPVTSKIGLNDICQFCFVKSALVLQPFCSVVCACRSQRPPAAGPRRRVGGVGRFGTAGLFATYLAFFYLFF